MIRGSTLHYKSSTLTVGLLICSKMYNQFNFLSLFVVIIRNINPIF